MDGADDFRNQPDDRSRNFGQSVCGEYVASLFVGIGKRDAAQSVCARSVRDFSIFRQRRRHFEGSDKATRIGATVPAEVDGSSMIYRSTNDRQAQRHVDCVAKTRVFQYR